MSLENQQNFEERRDSIRAPRIVTVKHRPVNPKDKKLKNLWQLSATQNMSLGGLLFVSAIPYEKGELVELEVVMSGLLDLFKGYAEIVRSVKHEAGHYYVAVKYVDLKVTPKIDKKIKTKTTARKRSAKTHLKKPHK